MLRANTEVSYYILFTSFPSAYVAMKLLNSFSLRRSLSLLSVQWCPTQDYDSFSHAFQLYHSKVEWISSYHSDASVIHEK